MSYLVVDQVSKKYGAVEALKSFSLSVERGKIFALVGPDGAGKTTLIRILCGLIDADSGSAKFNGLDLFTHFDKIKPELGYMPQVFSLYPDLSVEENLVFYSGIFGVEGEEFKRRRDQLYEFSHLGPFADRRASALSGGMKQKLALSCALMHEPSLLILDEPTTGVDPLSRRQFWEILADLKNSGSTILVSTPYMDEAARADRACFVFGGKKLSEDTPTDLAKQYRGRIYSIERQLNPKQLEQLNISKDLHVRRFGAETHFSIEPSDSIERHTEQLTSAGVETRELREVSPSLEDRFIQLIEEKV